MSHVTTLGDFRFPWYVRLLFSLQRRRYGKALEPTRLWGRTPRACIAMAAMYAALDRKSSPLVPSLGSLLQVRVSQINGCAFCVDINSAAGLRRNATGQKLLALPHFSGSPLFSEAEKAALGYAEAMTDSNLHVDTELVTRLRRHYSDDAIVELTAWIAFQNMSSKFNAAPGVPAQGFCSTAPATRVHEPKPAEPWNDRQ